MNLTDIQKLLPKPIETASDFTKSNKSIEQEDAEFLYFLYIRDFNSKGVISPLVLVKPMIKDILLNKRKVKFLNDLETKIYNDAQDHNNFVIYNLVKKGKWSLNTPR